MADRRDEEETQAYRLPAAPAEPQLADWRAATSAAPPSAPPTDFEAAPPSTPGWPGSNSAAAVPTQPVAPDTLAVAPARRAHAQPTEYRTSGLVALGAIVLLLMGLLLMLAGAVGLATADTLVPSMRAIATNLNLSLPPRQALLGAIGVLAIVALIVGLLHAVSGVGALAHRQWARWLGATLALLGTLVTALGLYTAVTLTPATATVPTAALVIALVALALYTYSLLALLFGSAHFEPRNGTR